MRPKTKSVIVAHLRQRIADDPTITHIPLPVAWVNVLIADAPSPDPAPPADATLQTSEAPPKTRRSRKPTES